ncbi:ABC transporter permease subunit [Metabacillus sp. 113a]|uniref:ABC transporter permease subunit n=1 Tax=Metabacillus sp. 113a TaxID=3404706 RepID=UPI003CFB3E37
MVAKGLILKEIRQAYIGLITASAVLIVYLPWMIMNAYSSYLEYGDGKFEFSMFESSFNGVTLLMPFILAIGMLGSEKQRGSMDFTLALPFKRSAIFWVKWLVGTITIVISLIVSFCVSSVTLNITGAFVLESTVQYYLYLTLSAVMIYSLLFAAGCLTGTSFAQGMVGGSMLLLPVLIVSVSIMNLDVFMDASALYNQGFADILINFSGLNIVWYDDTTMIERIITPLCLTILYTAIGYAAFLRHPAERNGYFFLWKSFNLPVFLIVLLLGMFGFGGFGYSIGGESIPGYITGILIGAGTGAAIGYVTIYKKAK